MSGTACDRARTGACRAEVNRQKGGRRPAFLTRGVCRGSRGAAVIPPLRRRENIRGDIENLCKGDQLHIGDVAAVVFDSGDGVLVHIAARKLRLIGQDPLRPVALLAQLDELVADQIPLSCNWIWLWHMAALLSYRCSCGRTPPRCRRGARRLEERCGIRDKDSDTNIP